RITTGRPFRCVALGDVDLPMRSDHQENEIVSLPNERRRAHTRKREKIAKRRSLDERDYRMPWFSCRHCHLGGFRPPRCKRDQRCPYRSARGRVRIISKNEELSLAHVGAAFSRPPLNAGRASRSTSRDDGYDR